MPRGRVTTSRTYGLYTGQMLGQGTTLGATPLYAVGSMGWVGEKLTQMTEAVSGTSYAWAYDGGGRLVTATAAAPTTAGTGQNYAHSFAFTPLWNLERANVAWNGSATTTQGYSYAGTDQATQAPGAGAAAYSLVHDGSGNLATRTAGAASETFTYTAEGLLRSVARSAGSGEVLYYDPFGNLAYRRSGTSLWLHVGEQATVTGTTTCVVDPCAPTAGTVKVNVHVLLGGSRIATVRTSQGQTTNQAFTSVLYYHRDRQGSVVATTTTGGVLGVQYRYGPYGELDKVTGSEAAAGSELGYTGGLRLTGGLVHLQARVYDPAYRRFLQADTVDPLRYTYTRGDPTNYVDPSGRRYELPQQGGTAFYENFGEASLSALLGDTQGAIDGGVHIPFAAEVACSVYGAICISVRLNQASYDMSRDTNGWITAQSTIAGVASAIANPYELVGPLFESIGSWGTGERNYAKLTAATVIQTGVVAIIGVAAIGGASIPLGAAIVMGALGNVGANLLTALAFGEAYTWKEAAFDSAVGAVGAVIPALWAKSALKVVGGVTPQLARQLNWANALWGAEIGTASGWSRKQIVGGVAP